MNLIEIKNVTTTYNGHIAIKDVSFNIQKGDYICLIGENGSGKSTLIKTLVGLNKKDSGEIIKNINPERISYLAQNNMVDLEFPATAKEIIMTGVQKHRTLPFYNKEEKKNAIESLKRLDAWDLRKKTFRNLSGGQKQRVLLARALTATSKIILLDEPVAGLDPKVTEELYRVVKSLNEDGVTIIMISHDISTAVKYSSHILHLGHKQLFFGKTSDYLQSDAYKFFSSVEVDEEEQEA